MLRSYDDHIQNAIAAARDLRTRAGGSSDEPLATDLLALVERDLSVSVCILHLPEGVAGAYLRKRGSSFIFVQAVDYPTRQRFTLAHEIGHHLLGHSGRVESVAEIGADTAEPPEQQANAFAREFLMPVSAIKSWLDDHGGKPFTMRDLVKLADTFLVSPPAMLYRLNQRDFNLPRSDTQRLWLQVRNRDHLNPAYGLGRQRRRDQISENFARTNKGLGPPRLPAAVSGSARAAQTTEFIAGQRLDALVG